MEKTSKILVVYYSFEGNTKFVAEVLAEELQADIQAVLPKDEIKSKGFGKYIWGGRQVVMGKKPELLPINVDFDAYDLILVGTPVWAGTYAPPIKTLLEGDLIKGKKVGYFFTHQGGAIKTSDKGEKAIEANNTFVSSLSVVNPLKRREAAKNEAIEWAKSFM